MARYKNAGIPVHSFPMRSFLGLEAMQQAVRLIRLLRRERAEIVHSHDAYTSVYGTICARLAGVRGVIASRRSWYSPHLKGRILRANRVAYRLADRVLGNSPSVSRLVESEGGVSASRIVTIPNFLDPESFEPMPPADRRAMLDELGVPADAFVVGIVARLSPVKDHANLLHAIASLRERIPTLRCVLIGDGPERRAIEALADSLGIRDIVHLAGERTQPPNLHGLFDVSVLCSTTEAFPNSVLEAMAAARPVVVTAVGGNPEIVRDGIDGLLAPRGDAGAIAAALLRVLGDDDLARRLGSSGARRVAETYLLDRTVERYYALYAAEARAATTH